MMKFFSNLLDTVFLILKVLICLSAVSFLAIVATFFLMIFLPEQTQGALQYFVNLLTTLSQ